MICIILKHCTTLHKQWDVDSWQILEASIELLYRESWDTYMARWTLGYVFMFVKRFMRYWYGTMDKGCIWEKIYQCIIWTNPLHEQKDPIIAFSSIEAKYIVVFEPSLEVISLRRLLEDIGFKQKKIGSSLQHKNKICKWR
jgi:hypothetical protein